MESMNLSARGELERIYPGGPKEIPDDGDWRWVTRKAIVKWLRDLFMR
jgi:hypothetical protein